MKLGIVELSGEFDSGSSTVASSRIMTEHSAFSSLESITYSNHNFKACSIASDCETACGPGSLPSLRCRCVNNQCVSEHATQVASRMVSHHDCLDGQPTPQGQQVLDSLPPEWAGVQFDPCTEQDFMAARAKLYVGNELEDPDGPLKTSVGQLKKMYDFMADNGVRIVNESWGIGTNYDNHGYLVDLYTRKHHITFVQAAGQLTSARTQAQHACQGFASICVGGLQTDLGADVDGGLFQTPFPDIFDGWILWAFSPRKNDRLFLDDLAEKPDIVAPAELTHVVGFPPYSATSSNDYDSHQVETSMGTQTIDRWTRQTGTSFAAPLVAGALALYIENCGSAPPPNVLRARLRTGHGLFGNYETNHPFLASGDWDPTCTSTASDLSYPSAENGCDFLAGVGPLYAGSLRMYENGAELCPATDQCGGGTLPAPAADFCAYPTLGSSTERDYACNEGSTYFEDDILLSGPDDSRLEIPTPGIDPLPPDKRFHRAYQFTAPNGFALRATLSSYVCPTKSLQTLLQEEEQAGEGIVERRPFLPNDVKLAVDFDLMVLGKMPGADKDTDPWVVLDEADSPGLLEVNEGLFFSTPSAYSRVEVWRVVPAQFEPCDPQFNHGNGTDEPSSLSLIRWGYPIP